MQLFVKNLNKKYNSQIILDNFSYKFQSNKIYFIKGVSGSGKTTLLNCISNLIEVDSGNIFFNGHNIFQDVEYKKKYLRNLSYIHQEDKLFAHFTAMENIIFPIAYHEKKTAIEKIEKKAKTLAEYLGVFPILNKNVNNLSGGERQRVAILRAMLMQPNILLADEPTAHVDKNTKQEIVNAFKKTKNPKTIIIIVSHDDIFKEICDEIINFDNMNEVE